MTQDIQHPADPFALVGSSWPAESEAAYHSAEVAASDASALVSTQAQSASDAATKTEDGMRGETADSVSSAYGHQAGQLRQQSENYTTISSWMLDASAKVRTAKTAISDLVSAGTQEIKDALSSETQGTPTSPSSTELTAKYRADISQVKAKLDGDLAAIGHSLAGDPGASRTPSYVSVSLTPTPEHHNPADQVAAYNHGPAPEVTPQVLPEMPRASNAETPSAPSSPSAPAAHPMNPTLAGLISPQGASGSAGSPSWNGAGTPGASSGAGAGTSGSQPQGHQAPEQRQTPKAPGLPGIPNIPLPNIPAAAESIATAVTSAAGGAQLPTAVGQASTAAPQTPASTGFTPGTSGAPPVPPMTPGLGPIGGLGTPPVVQGGTPAPAGTPGAPATGAQTPQQVSTPAPRGPVVDTAWLQKTYGLAPGVEAPKPETPVIPALFITSLPESEAHLHRTLASIRQQFEQSNWGQPIAVATITRGLETRTVYVTSDGLSIWPQGVALPAEVIPLDEMPSIPSTPELSGSLMVTDKLAALIPRGWTVEHLLSTVPGGETSQSVEQYQQLVDAGELSPCTVSRGDNAMTEGEAVQAFALAVLGPNAPGISDLGTDSARLKAARWVGVQPSGYLDVLARWHLSNAADAMSRGLWGEVVHAIEKFQSINQVKSQAA
ncbi:hypothetical protein [Mycobacteroides abscessus]|uniref:hypothetical protein n=1 Tax=Mycobacteroides abscessus TaxID=36809 RepID=UPI001F409AB1|nr:hypothetical protein [Mycobacteroides abscessus]